MSTIVPIVGLEKLYVAKLLKDDTTGVTYDKPVYLEGIKEISLKPKVNSDEFYAENILWMSENTLANIDVEIDITDLSEENEALLLGHALAEGGGVIKSAYNKAPDVAILYKSNKGNGKGRFQVLYKGNFSISDESIKGKEGKSSFQAKKLKATFAPLHNNGMWSYKVDEDSAGASTGLETKFFTSVMMPTEKTTTAPITP